MTRSMYEFRVSDKIWKLYLDKEDRRWWVCVGSDVMLNEIGMYLRTNENFIIQVVYKGETK